MRYLLPVALLFWGGLVEGAPVVSPSTPTVLLGGQIQFSSTDTVTWSMMPGSTGTISAGGLYTAPASFQARNQIAGCPVLPNDHIYNVDITSLPVSTNSATRIANIAGFAPIQFETDFPLNIMNNATPTDTMKFYYTTGNDGKQFPIVAAPYRGVESALYPSNYFAQDRHQLGLSTSTCQMTEIYNYYPVGTAGPVEGCPTCNAQSGVQYGPMSYQLADAGGGGGSIDAAGMYILPLLVRYDELKAGHIDHALRFTLSGGYIQPKSTWPATNFAGSCGSDTTCFPFGSWWRLKSSVDISTYSPTAQVILRALKTHGMILADNGGLMHIQVAKEVDSDTTTWNVFHNELRFGTQPDQTKFDEIDLTSLMVSTNSGHVKVPNTYQVVPNNYAIVIATKNSDSTATYTYVAIQPVTIGMKNPAFPANTGSLSVMEKTPEFQIPYWVNGATTTTVSCTMSPTIGSLTSDCLYTAPSSGTVASSTTLITITPAGVVGTTATITFPLTVFPASGIRVMVGSKAGTIISPVIPYDALGNYGPDVLGKYWANRPTGSVPAWYSLDDNSYPQSSWPAANDIGLYYTQGHGASDQAWSAMVPNGSYALTLKFGIFDPFQIDHSSITVDSQGLVLLTTATAVIPSYLPYTPSDHAYVVQVTNNQFYFAVRQIYSTNFTFLNAWSLIPIFPPPPAVSCNGPIKMNGTLTVK